MKCLIALYDEPLRNIQVVGMIDALIQLLACLVVYDPKVKQLEIRDLDGGLVRDGIEKDSITRRKQ